jgi:ABC-type transport system involved in multi-copper enzyme maturation permease subunit
MTGDIKRVVAAERIKLRRSGTTWFVPAAAAVMTLLVFLAVAYAAARDWIGVPSGFYLASSTSGWMVNITALLAMIVTCFQISGEFALGTVKPAWVKGLSRHGWLSGKIVTASAAVTVLFLIVVIAALCSAWARYGFADLKEKDFVVHTAASLWRAYLLCAGLTLFSLWAAVSVTAMVSTLLSRPGSAIAVSILLAVGLNLLGVFEPVRFFLLTYAISLPYEQMTAMTKGIPLPLEWGQLVWRTLACAGGWLAVSFAVGQMIIGRKEITF